MTKTPAVEPGYPFQFKVGSRTYYLTASSFEERTSWIKALMTGGVKLSPIFNSKEFELNLEGKDLKELDAGTLEKQVNRMIKLRVFTGDIEFANHQLVL